MNIGVDVDGVLTDVADYQLKLGVPFFKEKYGYEVVNPDAFDIKDIFGCTDAERRAFGKKTLWTYIFKYPAREEASQVIRKLRHEGHKIFIITSRVFTTTQSRMFCVLPSPQESLLCLLSRAFLKNWLWRRKIPFDGIFFCSDQNAVDKYLACKKCGADIIVEDKAENIMALSKITKVICFDAAYNRDCEGENISRVTDWGEVYRLISTHMQLTL